MRSEIFGRVYEVEEIFGTEFFLKASANANADAAPIVATPPAPEPTVGGISFDAVDTAVYLLTFPLDLLGDANRVLKTHAMIVSNPWVAIIVKFALGWSSQRLLAEVAKQRQLLFEHWRKLGGYEDRAIDKGRVWEISFPFWRQDDEAKPPPKTLKPSSHWLNSSTPLALRAPTFAA